AEVGNLIDRCIEPWRWQLPCQKRRDAAAVGREARRKLAREEVNVLRIPIVEQIPDRGQTRLLEGPNHRYEAAQINVSPPLPPRPAGGRGPPSGRASGPASCRRR